jgi:hypothetical protein
MYHLILKNKGKNKPTAKTQLHQRATEAGSTCRRLLGSASNYASIKVLNMHADAVAATRTLWLLKGILVG